MWTDGSVSFSLWQRRLWSISQLLALWRWDHAFCFGRQAHSLLKFFRWSLRHSVSCPLISATPTSLPFVISSLPVRLSICSQHTVFSSIFSFAQILCQELSLLFLFLSSCTIRLQWIPTQLIFSGYDAADELAWRDALLLPSAVPCIFSPPKFCIHSSLLSDWRRTASSKFFDTQVPSVSTEELVFPCHACCVFCRLCCNGHCLLLRPYFSRIGRTKNALCRACDHATEDTSDLILHCPATDCLRCSLFGYSLSLCNLWDRPWRVSRLLGFHGLSLCPIPRKGSGNNNNRYFFVTLMPQKYNHNFVHMTGGSRVAGK